MSILSDEKQYHLQVGKADVGKYVLLPGDPGRVEIIASHLDHAQKVAQNREYTTFTGYLEGERVSVASDGNRRAVCRDCRGGTGEVRLPYLYSDRQQRRYSGRCYGR